MKQGATVKRGDTLIRFDADYIATHAKSLLTQVVITNSQRVRRFQPASGKVIANRDACLELELNDAVATQDNTGGATVTSNAILVPNPTGLHARPAAVLAGLAKSFRSDVRLRKGDHEGNAKSVVGVMALNVAMGDKIRIIATGPDARAAADRLATEIAAGLGDDTEAVSGAQAVAETAAAAPPIPRSADENVLVGVAASPGLAVGTVSQVRHRQLDVHENARESAHDERRQLDEAIDRARLQLSSLQGTMQHRTDKDEAGIFGAHQQLLEDPELLDVAQSAIDKGKSSAFAWQLAFTTSAERLAGLGNELLAARANDLRDVGRRVLRIFAWRQRQRTSRLRR